MVKIVVIAGPVIPSDQKSQPMIALIVDVNDLQNMSNKVVDFDVLWRILLNNNVEPT